MSVGVLRGPVAAALRPRRRRIYREFAEQEVVIATGPRKGTRFSCGFRPWVGEVLDEYDRGRYWRFFMVGPPQDGKTLTGFIIPALYEIFENERDVILGGPTVELAQAAYRQKLLPSIVAGQYRRFLPRHGGGSRGGKSLYIQYEHGPVLRFMGAGGGDAQRSSDTAPVVIMTELDKMDDPGMASEEADPVTQMQARLGAFLAIGAARVYGECTMSTEEGIVYREVCEIGTDSRLHLPCVHCGAFVFPERKGFGGWQDAKTVMEARGKGAFTCSDCGIPWTEFDRQRSLKGARLVARGQTIGKDGVLVGEPPDTNTFGVRWNAMASPFMTMGDIAEAEWRAEKSETEGDSKAVVQYKWAEPWKPELLNLAGLTREIVLGKVTQLPRGTLPAEAVRLTVAIDPGLHRCWWTALAWLPDARGYVIDYGALEVPEDRQTKPLAILATLRTFRDEVLVHGWSGPGGTVGPDLVIIDTGYAESQESVYQFVLESGQGRYAASKGFGTRQRQESWRAPSTGAGRELGNEWFASPQPSGIKLVNLHADYWKAQVHAGFAAPPGGAGSLSLFRGDPQVHAAFARQITAERREAEFVPGKGERIFWNRLRHDNHWLDCASMARAAADMIGIRLITPAGAPSPGPAPETGEGGARGGWLKTSY